MPKEYLWMLQVTLKCTQIDEVHTTEIAKWEDFVGCGRQDKEDQLRALVGRSKLSCAQARSKMRSLTHVWLCEG